MQKYDDHTPELLIESGPQLGGPEVQEKARRCRDTAAADGKAASLNVQVVSEGAASTSLQRET